MRWQWAHNELSILLTLSLWSFYVARFNWPRCWKYRERKKSNANWVEVGVNAYILTFQWSIEQMKKLYLNLGYNRIFLLRRDKGIIRFLCDTVQICRHHSSDFDLVAVFFLADDHRALFSQRFSINRAYRAFLRGVCVSMTICPAFIRSLYFDKVFVVAWQSSNSHRTHHKQ